MKRSLGLKRVHLALLLTLGGCAGFQRGCSSWNASNFGSDWIVVQYRYSGEAQNCWKLPNTSIANEGNSDGIYWLDSNTGHLVHISGWYNRVQVNRGDYERAAALIGVDARRCNDGVYPQASMSGFARSPEVPIKRSPE